MNNQEFVEKLRVEFNSEYKSFNDDFFTDYELFLEKKLLQLKEKEFKRFMKLQKEEIEKYKWTESEKAGKDLENQCCEEWIQKYADAFAKKYWEL